MLHKKSLGNSEFTTGNRIYKIIKIKGTRQNKCELVAWNQNKCIICGRFLNKLQRKYCSKCKPIMDKIISKLINKKRYDEDIMYKNKQLNKSKKQYRNKKGVM